jgi:hypothetical protein
MNFGRCTFGKKFGNCAGMAGFFGRPKNDPHWQPVEYLPDWENSDGYNYYRFSCGNVFWICPACHEDFWPKLHYVPILRKLKEGKMDE